MLDSPPPDLFLPDQALPPHKEVERKSALGQFMTPPNIAQFMARLFKQPFPDNIRLLDAGAGRGALITAFIDNWRSQCPSGRLSAHAYEFDAAIIKELRQTLDRVNADTTIEASITAGDFIEHAATMIRLGRGPRYTHAILNPPYKKINTASAHRSLLRAAGLETVNLYSGFVGLAVELLEHGGEIVAIVPRSFCNGPYYEPFRRYILTRAAIRHIHLFDARNKAFKADRVLQENIIISLERSAPQGPVTISTSEDESFNDYQQTIFPFEQIVFPDDPDQFIHIPTGDNSGLTKSSAFSHALTEIGLSVSTGPVVDFRLRADLRANPEPGTVPLLYAGHFVGAAMEWPKSAFKKPNAILNNRTTAKWLYPSGYYTVVRRFSSKEERRRIVANVVDPTPLSAPMIGFENHLNVFHEGRQPLAENIARGLTVYLNTTMVDQYFRRFNGHTQVNATDLRSLRYPSREALIALGIWSKTNAPLTQDAIDEKVSSIA